MGRARREAMARLVRSMVAGAQGCTAWAWGMATMCLVRPVEGQVQVVLQWVVRTEQAVGQAVEALRDTEQLQRALGDALGNATRQAVWVRNVTARMLDTSRKGGGGPTPTPTPIPANASLESETVVLAAVGGLALVGVAWVMSRRPWVAPVTGQGAALTAPVIKVRLHRL